MNYTCTPAPHPCVYSHRMYAIVEQAQVDPGAETLRRAKEGDHDAFADIVAEHESMVYSLVYHFFGNRERSEEIAQEVFLQLYRKLREIESPAHLLFWLRQVTARRCIDALRRARLRSVALDDGLQIGSHDREADPLIERTLRRLVAELPDVQRLVVTLRYQEDLDPSDICRIAGMPVNTVKSHLHRAIQALRKKLGDH